MDKVHFWQHQSLFFDLYWMIHYLIYSNQWLFNCFIKFQTVSRMLLNLHRYLRCSKISIQKLNLSVYLSFSQSLIVFFLLNDNHVYSFHRYLMNENVMKMNLNHQNFFLLLKSCMSIMISIRLYKLTLQNAMMKVHGAIDFETSYSFA